MAKKTKDQSMMYLVVLAVVAVLVGLYFWQTMKPATPSMYQTEETTDEILLDDQGNPLDADTYEGE